MADKYATFIHETVKRQRRYITQERQRYLRARRLLWRYAKQMESIGLHALTGHEIADRLRELQDMQANIADTHGDTPERRAFYDGMQAPPHAD